MRLRYVASLNPSVPGLGRRDVGTDVSFLPLDRIWSDDRFDPSQTIEFEGDVQSYNPVAEGDILLPKVSPTFAHGRVAIATGLANGRALATSEVFVIRAVDRNDARFLKYRLLAQDFITEGVASWTGVAGLKRVSAEFVLNTRISTVAWARRHAIADFLNRESERIGRLDSGCSKLETVLAEPALSRFVELTAERPLTRVGYHYDVQLGKMLDEGKASDGDLVPYLRNQNVDWDRVDLTDVKHMRLTATERRKYALRVGDLVACEGRHVGKSAVWTGAVEPMYFQKALHRIRPRMAWSARYLMWCLWLGNTRGDYYADGTGSTIPHLPAEKMRAVRIPSASSEEQAEIVREVDAVHARSRAARDELERFRSGLADYRGALVTEAVTGRLDVLRVSDEQADEAAMAVREGAAAELLSR
jgi:type I restriction enzyme S subunit